MINILNEFKKISNDFKSYHHNTIPLCAAENVMSDFCKLPLCAGFQERYIMGSVYAYHTDGNFVGSEHLLPFYEMIDKQCNRLFHSKFADVRTLTGMNCLTTILMSISQPGDSIMILSADYGGHASVKGICERLSLKIFDAPYILDDYDFDYEIMNKIIEREKIKFVLFAPSDILFPMELTKITDENVIILYDASQILGLIAADIIENPLPQIKNIIMFGGTHKTLPGPAHGIALTNNESLFKIIDNGINPKYLRNTQMHQVISLLFCLIEAEYFGREYQSNIVRTSNVLARYLKEYGFTVPIIPSPVIHHLNTMHNFDTMQTPLHSMTHQIFIECSPEKMEKIYNNCIASGVTLNTKKKKLFHGGYGVRLGTQEIARYKWDDLALKRIAEIIYLLSADTPDLEEIFFIKNKMPPKVINYTFSNEIINDLHLL
jgi:glycine/serine hydroxymethyltransferase